MSRVLPNVALNGGYADSEDGWGVEMNANLLKLSVLTQAAASGLVAALPGSPAAGTTVILNETVAGGNANKVAVYDNNAWSYFTPQEGWLAYDQGLDRYLSFDGAKWNELATKSKSPRPFKVPGFATTTPQASENLVLVVADEAFTFPANFAGSQAKCGTNPGAAFVLTVKNGATTIGTISIATTGVATFATQGGTAKAVAVGDLLSVQAPGNADLSIANLAFTLKGNLDA